MTTSINLCGATIYKLYILQYHFFPLDERQRLWLWWGLDKALVKETIHIGSTVQCPSFPDMSINYSDVGGKKACQTATETLPVLYRKMSLEVWQNTGKARSQTFPGLSVAHHQSAGVTWHSCPSSAGSHRGRWVTGAATGSCDTLKLGTCWHVPFSQLLHPPVLPSPWAERSPRKSWQCVSARCAHWALD